PITKNYLDLTLIHVSQIQVIFGDGGTKLATAVSRPTESWPKWKMSPQDARREWDKYKTGPATYRPPNPPDNSIDGLP
ncbi:MAG: hypothetical protein AAFY73_15365, partial [Pseudomonadota bacterium]